MLESNSSIKNHQLLEQEQLSDYHHHHQQQYQQQSHDPESEAILESHFMRMQETLLDSVDAKVRAVEGELRETQILLKRTDEEKITSGQALHQAKTELKKLNHLLANTYDCLGMGNMRGVVTLLLLGGMRCIGKRLSDWQ
jgi:hypothetical protein